jgi:hypothetical protein
VTGLGTVQTVFDESPCLTGVVAIDDSTLRVTESCTGRLIELTRM